MRKRIRRQSNKVVADYRTSATPQLPGPGGIFSLGDLSFDLLINSRQIIIPFSTGGQVFYYLFYFILFTVFTVLVLLFIIKKI